MTELIHENAALLANLSLILIVTLVSLLSLEHPSIRSARTPVWALGLGVLFGGTIVLSLNMSFEISEGVFTDLRTLPAVLSGMLGGPLAAALAAFIGSTGRWYIGGSGWVSGVINILIPTILGYFIWRLLQNRVSRISLRYTAGAILFSSLLAMPVALIYMPITRGWDATTWFEFVGMPTLFSLFAVVLMGSVWKLFQRLQLANVQLLDALKIERETLSESNAALNTNVDRLQLALHGSGLGLWEWNPSTGETWVDERWSEMLGLKVSEFEHTIESWSQRVHPDDMESCLDKLRANIEGETDFYESIHRMRHKDGHWITVKDVGRVSDRDDRGRVVRFTGSHQDISKLVEEHREAERSLNQLSDIVSAGRIGLYIYHVDDDRFEANDTFREIFELSETEFPNLHPDLMDLRYHPDFVEQYMVDRKVALASASNLKDRRVLLMPDGREKHIQISARIERQSGKAVTVIGSVLDQTFDVLRERELEQTAEEKSKLLSAVKLELRREQLASELGYGCKWELDLEQNRIRPDKALARWYGPRWVAGEWYPAEELLLAVPEEWRGSVAQLMIDARLRAMEDPANYLLITEYPFKRDDSGETIWLKVYGRVTKLEGRNTFVGQSIDITEEHEKGTQLAHLAFHDDLTNLPNREKVIADLGDRCKAKEDCQLAVLMVGLKEFRHYNNIFGRDFGNRILLSLAKTLSDNLASSEHLYRGPGGVFIILLDEVTRSDTLHEYCKKLLQLFESSLAVDSEDIGRRVVLGAVLGDSSTSDPEMLMQEAEMALSSAKRQQSERYVVFKPEMRDALHRRMQLQRDMREGLKRNEFELLYQPQLDLKQNTLVGAEALIRWNHPERGVVSPAEFIPVAEESDLIIEITRWVLDKACTQARQWQGAGWQNFRVSVNLSAKHFESPTIDADIQTALTLNQLTPELLELELTESALLEADTELPKLLERWSQQGISLAIDDFGTGYSNLSYLSELPIDKLKIDQSFVRDFNTNKNRRVVVQTTALMARALKMKTVVEGAETKGVIKALSAMGCDMVQGYAISRPLKPLALEQLVADYTVDPAAETD